MSEYTPDNWVVLKLNDKFYKVLGGWSGGYLDGDSWRMNSGIERTERIDDYYIFHGFSGSVYKCHVNGYGLRMNNSGIYNQLKEKFEDRVMLMDENTEWEKIQYVS